MKYVIKGPEGYVRIGQSFAWTDDLQKARVYNTKSAATNSYQYHFHRYYTRGPVISSTGVEIIPVQLRVEEL